MRVVVAIFEQLVPVSGGGTPRTTHIVRSLVRRGHQVHVAAAFAVPDDVARRELECASVWPLRHVSRLDKNKFVKYLLAYPWNLASLVACIARLRPDVVISHNSVAGRGALFARSFGSRPVAVMDLTDLLFEYLDSYGSWWVAAVARVGRALERHAVAHSDHVITISEAMRGILMQDYGLLGQRAAIVHDGVDTDVFHPVDASDLRHRLSPWAQHVCIIHGVVDPQDGPELLVKAAPLVLQKCPQTAFWVVGDGAAVPAMKSLAAQLGVADRFHFSGWLPQSEVVRYINASDLGLVILPDVLSARGRVTLKEFEYWACAKPAVLPRLPALEEMVEDGRASLFYTPGDATDLAREVCALLTDPQRRSTMGRNGRDLVTREFEWRSLGDQIASLCESYAAEHPAT